MLPSFDPELIKIIRCPVTKTPLKQASAETVDQLNQKIENGTLTNRIGQSVSSKIEAGFINADESLLLPVRGGIVILITDQAIPLN